MKISQLVATARRKGRSAVSASTARLRRGTTAVEFAVVAPIIFLFFMGGLELSAVNFVRQTACNASYEACRKVIIPGGTVAEAQAEAMRLMNALGLGAGVTVTVTQDSQQATVVIQVPASLHSWGLVRFTGNKTIRQACTLTKE